MDSQLFLTRTADSVLCNMQQINNKMETKQIGFFTS